MTNTLEGRTKAGHTFTVSPRYSVCLYVLDARGRKAMVDYLIKNRSLYFGDVQCSIQSVQAVLADIATWPHDEVCAAVQQAPGKEAGLDAVLRLIGENT